MTDGIGVIDCLVVGAGIIGLSVARQLALVGREVLLVDRHRAIGTEISSRNSEVIHSGLYYPAGSLKARTCVRGRELLYEYCEQYAVPYRRCGKLIVAADEAQLSDLERIAEAARRNGVFDLQRISGVEARQLEPELECVAALRSPSTGIVDSHALMMSLLADAERLGVVLALQSEVSSVSAVSGGFLVEFNGPTDTCLEARWLVNAAGLGAVPLARNISGLAPKLVPPIHFAKGNYFALSGRAPFSTLVYPVPEPGGLGIHFTIDLAGQARFGPDVEWVDNLDYQVDLARGERFYASVRRYWPALPDGALRPAYSGIRPKLSGAGQPAADFRIDGPRTHGLPGLVNLFGIESPGLTASLALAELVATALVD